MRVSVNLIILAQIQLAEIQHMGIRTINILEVVGIGIWIQFALTHANLID